MNAARAFLTALILLAAADAPTSMPTRDDGSWYIIPEDALSLGPHHLRHAQVFGSRISGFNHEVLRGIDIVQASAPDGGGYFADPKATPAESPIGYTLKLFGRPLLDPPRTTSYCSGSSYAAFIEAMNLILDSTQTISPERLESIRMQELDGSRREDGIKFWGHWNDDGFGSHFALVQYSGMGIEIKPNQARPGDFMNISWKSGAGHSVVFLGWCKDQSGNKSVLYWASQKGTNGLGDQIASIDRIKDVKIVRLVAPEKLFTFDPMAKVKRKIPGDRIEWN